MADYVLTGVVRRRSELTGEIKAIHERLRKLLADLKAVDASSLRSDSNHQVETIWRRAIRPPKD